MTLKIIHNKPKLTLSNPFFQECGCLPIKERVKLRICSIMYKAIQGQAPTNISHIFHKSNSEYRTRSIVRRDLKVPNRNMCITRKLCHTVEPPCITSSHPKSGRLVHSKPSKSSHHNYKMIK